MTKTTNKRAVAAGLTAGLLGGAAAGMVFGVPDVTGAVSPAVVQQDDTDTLTDAEPADEDRLTAARERLREALQPLVDDDTISADQADDVADHLLQEAQGKFGRFGGKGHMGHHRGGFGNFDVIEETLGMDAAEIGEALAEGSTLADLADDPQALIDALVAEAQTKLDEAVADGKLTAEEAAEKQAEIVERVSDMVNGEFEGRRGPGKWGGSADDSSADEEG